MSAEAIRRIIESEFTREWNAQTPVAYDGVEFNVPEKDNWVRLRILIGDTRQASMGVRKTWRTAGVVVIQCFTLYGKGTAEVMVLADKAGAIFQGKQLQGILFRGASIASSNRDADWWRVNVNCSFQADFML